MIRGKLGPALEQARLDAGFSRAQFARELNLSITLLEAIESESWTELPAGLERPLTRQVAARLGIDPSEFPDSWEAIPGAAGSDTPDPRREWMERAVMGLLSAGSVGLLLWLVIPGPRIRAGASTGPKTLPSPVHAPVPAAPPDQPYPVIGELIPEAPRNEDGILVTIRALDATQASLESEAGRNARVVQVSEPWRFRVKGPFVITLENAGVVKLEVGGRLIPHGQSVGEAWTGRFGPEGQWIPRGAPEVPAKASAPETDPVGEEGGRP
ncbi:MAG: helix-turn-helix domain-containing protein [Acidobacteria bacterium]|nr:helix-turn-helix domain-containing protein [Acidobacteriota bacterium]